MGEFYAMRDVSGRLREAESVALRRRPRWKARPARTLLASKTIELGSGTAVGVAMKPRFSPFESK